MSVRGAVHQPPGFSQGGFRLGFKGKAAAVLAAGLLRKHGQNLVQLKRFVMSVLCHCSASFASKGCFNVFSMEFKNSSVG